MVLDYLRAAWRNLLRNKTSSFINICGLSTGMAVAFLIGLWIYDELSFNRYHQHYNTIAQVMQNRTNSGGTSTSEMIPLPLAGTLKKDYGENFKYVVLSSAVWQHIIATGNKSLSLNGSYMEAEAPEMLTLDMIGGSQQALEGHSTILLSQSSAKGLFANEDAFGKVLNLDNKMTVKVGGIYKDLPSNTTFSNLAFIASWDLYAIADPNLVKSSGDWGNNSYDLYVQLKEHADANKVSVQIKDAKLKNVDAENAKTRPLIFLQPMSRWHLYSEFKNGVNTGGAIAHVWMFGAIGLLVLLLACINFMNLSTAKAEKRAQEVGIRKAIGSLRSQLVLQFLTESLLLSFLSFGVSLAVAALALPAFNQVADKNLDILWNSPVFWLTGIAFSVLVGILAGSYPAFYLSAFRPVKVLKGTYHAGKWAALPRQVLVVAQFAVSIVLIIGTLVVLRQVRFSQDRQVGYDREGLISIEMNSANIHDHFSSFRNDLLNTGAVIEIAESGSPATGLYNIVGSLKWPGKDPGFSDEFAAIDVSTHYGKTLGWQLSRGRDFSSAFLSDSSAIILNEAAVSYMNLKDPVGQTIDWWGKKYSVIGVVKNMVMQSPYEPAKQTLFFISGGAGNFLSLRLNPNKNLHSSLASIAAVWKNYSPNEPFDFRFVDHEYQKKFQSEQKIGTLCGVFSALAIIISCLGVFGMAVFMAEQRTKEIGVRKVLGATVFDLWFLLCKDFVLFVMIASAIAMPLASLIMQSWLLNYSYHTGLSVSIFIVTGLGALVLTLSTVSYQTIRAALMNPVKSLKTE